MSNQKSKHPYDDFEEEMERMLESLSDCEDEEDFGYFSPNRAWRNPISCDDLDDEGDTPPPIPKEAQCRHKETEKRYLINSHYYVCKKCGKDLGNKAPKNEDN